MHKVFYNRFFSLFSLLFLFCCEIKQSSTEEKIIEDSLKKRITEIMEGSKPRISFDYFDTNSPFHIFFYTEDDKRICVTYRLDGSMESISFLKRNEIDGSYVSFHLNNQLFEKFEYNDGKLWNIISISALSGDKLDFGTFQKGNGLVKLYNYDASLREWGYYKHGMREGYWKYKSNTGHIDSVLFERGISKIE